MAVPKQNSETGKRWSELDWPARLRFMGKALVFFASGGFIFPTIWID